MSGDYEDYSESGEDSDFQMPATMQQLQEYVKELQ